MQVQAFSGSQVSSDPFDQQSGAVVNTTTAENTGSITPTTNNQLVVSGGGWGTFGNPWSASVDSGMTLIGIEMPDRM